MPPEVLSRNGEADDVEQEMDGVVCEHDGRRHVGRRVHYQLVRLPGRLSHHADRELVVLVGFRSRRRERFSDC